MAMTSTLGALCAYLSLPPRTQTSTINAKANFFRAVRAAMAGDIEDLLAACRTFFQAEQLKAQTGGGPGQGKDD